MTKITKMEEDRFIASIYSVSRYDSVSQFKELFANETYTHLLTSNVMKGVFKNACEHARVDILSYLLSEDDFKIHIQTNHDSKDSLLALMKNYKLVNIPIGKVIETIDYLLACPELKYYINIHNNKDEFFKQAYEGKHIEILKTLIINHNLEKTEEISNYLMKITSSYLTCVNMLASSPDTLKSIDMGCFHEVIDLFARRDLNTNLKKDLLENKSKPALRKI